MTKGKMITGIILVIILSVLLGQVVTAAEGSEELFKVEEIVVTASKYPEELAETTVSMESVTQEDIQEKNMQNTADLLNDLAGVYISDYGGPAGQKMISIRGSETNQVLVLVDGQPMNSRQNGQVDLSQLPVAQIDRIEVLKGPASALYGANALGGVVNIITRSGSQDPVTEFRAEYGSFATRNYTFTHRGSSDKTEYNIMIVRKKSNGNRDNSSLEQAMFSSRFDIELNRYNDLIFSFQHNDSDKGVPGLKTSPTPAAEQDDTDTNINVRWEQRQQNYDTNLTIYHKQHEQVYDNPDEWGYTGPSEHDTDRSGIEFNRTDYFEVHTLTYGLELKQNKIDSNENGRHDNLNKALFVQDKWQVIKPLEINFGGRVDNHEQFGSEFSPRAGAVYSLNDKVNIYGSAGKAYRTPTFNDLYWPADAYSEGNSDLNPETAVAYETGIRYSKQDIKAELNYFDRNIEDLIEWAAGDDYIYRPYNIDEARTTGAELILNKEYKAGISIDFNYTYLDSRDKETDDRLAPFHNANLGLTYTKDDISSSLTGHTVRNRPDELEDYTVFDAKISKEFEVESGKIEVAFKVNNLFNNEDYEVRKDYSMSDRNYMLEVGTTF